MINEFHTKRMEKIIQTAGGEILLGGKTDIKNKICDPTIILNPNRDAEIMTNEIFGPVLPVYTFKNIEEPIKFINDGDKPLAVYYMGDEYCQNAKKVLNETSSGSFITNEAMS